MRYNALFAYKKIKSLQLEYLLNVHNNKNNCNSRKAQSEIKKIFNF